MHRFFVKPEQIKKNHIRISGDDFKHLTKVLRVSDRELFEICDGQGMDYHCKICERGEDYIVAQVYNQQPSVGENPYTLTLFQGIPKGQKFEEIVQKGTECGVTRFVPFESTFCVAKIKNEKQAKKKQERWQRVAYEAAKQSKRGVIPEVFLPQCFDAVRDTLARYDLVLFAYEHEGERTLKDVLAELDSPDIQRIAMIIGSEGGFSPDEAAVLREKGAVSVSLGKRILRTETAGIVLAAQINYALSK